MWHAPASKVARCTASLKAIGFTKNITAIIYLQCHWFSDSALPVWQHCLQVLGFGFGAPPPFSILEAFCTFEARSARSLAGGCTECNALQGPDF